LTYQGGNSGLPPSTTFFVPLTIGLSILVAGMQTAWFIKKDLAYLRMTQFFGKLFLINFAVGVVTGIVLESQFGMNWSAYSRFVGDVFGAPLAREGLLAFFMESVFLGLWIFGWDKLTPRLHLATIWLPSGHVHPALRGTRGGRRVAHDPPHPGQRSAGAGRVRGRRAAARLLVLSLEECHEPRDPMVHSHRGPVDRLLRPGGL
jgi:hypothetical protein